MPYHVEYSDTALKQLKKMDRFDARLITSWIGKNLEGCSDPRIHGKGLTANRSGEWRYRIGNYRALCITEDDRLIIEVFSVGHRPTHLPVITRPHQHHPALPPNLYRHWR